ncbi:MAG: efflux RND transporter periplasmic adaptor subunit [Pseudomonadota bacterium]
MTQAQTSLIVVFAILAPLFAFAQDADTAVTDAQPVFVQTMTVPSAEQSLTRQFFGQVAALETVDISFEVGGSLTRLEAREGAFVARGEVLGQLDLAPFERAVERAKLTLAQAERDLERAQKLAQRNVTSAVQAENAETARDLADVALREARDALEDATITAPFDALVADRLGTAFANIEPGTPVLRLHNMSETRVEFDLPERLLTQIGDPADVTFKGRYVGRDADIPLAFREFRAETTGIGQSYTVSLAAAPVEDLRLLPGRTMTVMATLKQPSAAVGLPASAIVTQPDGRQTVVAVIPQGDALIARHVPVEVQSANGTDFTSVGLEPGLEIVAIGAHLIADGDLLKRFTRLTQEGS